MVKQYYQLLFPTRDRKKIMRNQIYLSNTVDGFSPVVTDDMEYLEFYEWRLEVEDMFESEDG